jgi:hypothetical protein
MASGTIAANNRQTTLEITTMGAAAHTIRNNEGMFLSALILFSHSTAHSGRIESCFSVVVSLMAFRHSIFRSKLNHPFRPDALQTL